MALFPCDVCHCRYVGVGSSAYLGWVGGGFNERNRFRLCPKHLEEMREYITAHLVLVQRGDQPVEGQTLMTEVCDDCGDLRSTVTWFAQVYDRKQDPEYYAGSFCAPCNEKLSLTPLVT